jgi:hypothetical protein
MMTAPDAATAVGFGDRPGPSRLRLISWQPFRKGPLRGFACVEISAIGLRIYDVPIRTGTNGLWAGLPAKPELDRDGRRKTDINGRALYKPVAEWRTREISDRFSEAVIAAVRRAHPGDLD